MVHQSHEHEHLEQHRNHHQHHHEHAGMSSRSFLDAGSILKQVGDLSGKTMLDIGCGDGHFSVAASELVEEFGKIFSIDVDEISINSLNNEIKQKGIRNITTILADFTMGTQIKENSVDICLMVNVFHGFVVNGEEEQVINEIRRLLKNNGELIIIEFKKIPNTPGPRFEERLSGDELERIIGQLGFKKKKIFVAGQLHYAIVFSK